MKKASNKLITEQSSGTITPQDALYLAIWCYCELTDDQSRLAKMTKADCAKLVIQHMEVVRNAQSEQWDRWINGDDKARDKDSILNAKIGMPKRDASSLMNDIAWTIERTFAKVPFSLPKLVKAMQQRGLPVRANETHALAEEITDVWKALGNDRDEEKERAIVLWNSHPKMVKRELEIAILGATYNPLSFFDSIKKYSEKTYGKGHLRQGNTGSPRIDRK